MDADPLPALSAFIPLLQNTGDPLMGISQIVALCVALLALMLSAFVSGSEIAFFSITPAQSEELEEENGREKTILKLLSKPERLLATILITNNLVNVSIVVLFNFALGALFGGMPEWLSFVLQSVILTFLILLFGEILPKIYANSNPMKFARFAAPGIMTLTKLLRPVSCVLEKSSSIVKKVVARQPRNITADELTQALEITDVKASEQKDMLEGILKFGDTTAGEIMTPRTEITDLECDMDFDEVMKVVLDSGYSRLPVSGKSLDDIKGILFARDLLPYVEGGCPEGFDWRSLLRKPYYVPEAKMIDDLLEEFRRLKVHIAIVVDEFGGTQGLVTLEDVLEEIVGDINDEYDEEETTFKKLREDTYLFEGKTLLTDFFRVTGLDGEDYTPVTEDAETLAGMLLAIKGDFPAPKETLVYGRCHFLVLDITEHRIAKVKVRILPEEGKEENKGTETD